MGYPHKPVVTAATAAKLQAKAAGGNLIRADGMVFSAAAGNYLIVYDIAAYAADSSSVGYAPLAVAALSPIVTAGGTVCVGSLDFKETPVRCDNGICIVLSTGATPYSATTSTATGYIMCQYE